MAPTTAASGWSRAGTRKQSVAESDAPPPGGGKPTSGRVIRIINNMDHSIQVSFLITSSNWCRNMVTVKNQRLDRSDLHLSIRCRETCKHSVILK